MPRTLRYRAVTPTYTSPVTNRNTVIQRATLPTIPTTGGGKFFDPTFTNIEIMRVTGTADGTCYGTVYSTVSSFNLDETRLISNSGDENQGIAIYGFNPTTFVLGTKGLLPASPAVRGDQAIWSLSNANHLYAMGTTVPKMYRIDVTNLASITTTEVADFSGVGSILSTDYFWQPSMADDNDYFGATWKDSSYAIKGYVVLRRSTTTVSCSHTQSPLDEVSISRDGTYVHVITGVVPSASSTFFHKVSDHTNTNRTEVQSLEHGDSFGTKGWIGNDDDTNLIVKTTMDAPATRTTVWDNENDYQFANHLSMRSTNQTELMIENYQSDSANWIRLSGEIVLVPMDGSLTIKRCFHHRSVYGPGDADTYTPQPRANISPTKKFVAFSSNMGVREGRVDLYVAKLAV